jgi:hypothetical protein
MFLVRVIEYHFSLEIYIQLSNNDALMTTLTKLDEQDKCLIGTMMYNKWQFFNDLKERIGNKCG